MFIEILIAIFVGIGCGIITGLLPGVHINLVSAMLISTSPFLLKHTPAIPLAVFVIAMSVVHTFLDVIPSIFLGAPEDATALGVLPGHRFLLRGEGLLAVKLCCIGSFGALILSVLLFPLFLVIVAYGYPFLQGYIAYLLIATALLMILRDKHKLWALAVFCLAGTLGLIVFNMLTLSNPLLPLLSGVFGIATLAVSLNSGGAVPAQQRESEVKLDRKTTAKALIAGQFSGFITAVLPGLSASIAAVTALQITRKLGDHGFMILMGSISTVNFVLSLAALYVLDKARNGSVIAVQSLIGQLDGVTLLILLCVALVAGGVAVLLTLRIGSVFAGFISRVNYPLLVVTIICFVTLLVLATSGFVGLLVLCVSVAIGVLPAVTKVSRTHAMGCIMVPVMIYFLR